MNNVEITNLLTILLAIGIAILGILIITFIIVSIVSKSKEKDKKNDKIKDKSPKVENKKSVEAKIYTKEDIKKFMEFDDIVDNMISTKDGKRFVMVIECQGVNYDLMSAMEKNSVERGFVQFLNTLTRPIQIYIQSRRVNLEDSIAGYKKRLENIDRSYSRIKMEKERMEREQISNVQTMNKINFEYTRLKNLYEYTQDLIKNTEKMSLNKNILTKKYYIVIYYYVEDTDDMFGKDEILDMAFSELYTNAQAIIRTLASCDVQGKILDSSQLIDLLYVAYNRDDAEILRADKSIKAGYDALYSTGKDVIEKRIELLDKLAQEKALEKANNAIEKAYLRSKREYEAKTKEERLEDTIRKIARSKIYENDDYLDDQIIEYAIEEIDSEENTSKKRKTVKKGDKK